MTDVDRSNHLDIDDDQAGELHAGLAEVINRLSLENASNTPDWVLAEHLVNYLAAFTTATRQRDRWYGITPSPGRSPIPASPPEPHHTEREVQRLRDALQTVVDCLPPDVIRLIGSDLGDGTKASTAAHAVSLARVTLTDTAPVDPADDEPYNRTSGPVHTWFELSYSSYQVLPRVLMQSMPLEWQRRMVDCLEQLHGEFDHVEQAPGYEVKPCDWVYVSDLTKGEAAATGVSVSYQAHSQDGAEFERPVYYVEGSEVPDIHQVPIPVRDPLPHYRHAYIPPASDTRLLRRGPVTPRHGQPELGDTQ